MIHYPLNVKPGLGKELQGRLVKTLNGYDCKHIHEKVNHGIQREMGGYFL
jgi:hypothetical protein